MKKYQIIYADPPWDYGGRTLQNQLKKDYSVNDHYPTMKTDELCNLPVKDLADKDCLLFMWVTYPHLENAFKLINSWGFKYSTVAFEWFKTHKSGKPTHFMGAWVVGGAIEICLLAKRGSVKRISKKVKRLIISERKQHSKKPEEARKRIVELVGNLPRCELFARQKTEGWDVWGNEVESDIVLKKDEEESK